MGCRAIRSDRFPPVVVPDSVQMAVSAMSSMAVNPLSARTIIPCPS